MADYNVGDLVAEFLHQAGIEVVFGVVSVHNIPMFDGIGRRNTIRLVGARGEMGAGHMADGYARARRGLGCFVTSTGPGAANAPGALVEARFGSAPVLHLTGQTATADLDQAHGAVHDVPDQLGMLKSVSKAAYRVRSPEAAFGVLIKAAAEALTPPMGPVSVEIPIDIQRAAIARPDQLDRLVLPVPTAEAGDAASLDRIAEMAAGAKRPLLWCGTGAKFARAAVERLAGIGFGIVTSINGRAVIPETHRMTLGAFNAVPAVRELYGDVDLMIGPGGDTAKVPGGGHEITIARNNDFGQPKPWIWRVALSVQNAQQWASIRYSTSAGLVGRSANQPCAVPLMWNVVPSTRAAAGADTFAELPVNPCKSDSRITFGSTVAPVWMMALNPGVSGSVSMVHSQDRCVHSTE